MAKVTLTIGRRFKGEFNTVAEARVKYVAERDESDEGASTFPDGTLKVAGKSMRFSYNARLWAGARYVRGGTEEQNNTSLDIATVDATLV